MTVNIGCAWRFLSNQNMAAIICKDFLTVQSGKIFGFPFTTVNVFELNQVLQQTFTSFSFLNKIEKNVLQVYCLITNKQFCCDHLNYLYAIFPVSKLN